MLMASTFLPLLFNNLPPIIRSHHLWTILFGLSILLFYPRVLKTPIMIPIILYGLILIIGLNVIWSNVDDWNINLLFNELYQISIGASVISYFLITKDYYGLAKITRMTLIFISVTAVMSIIISLINPSYARDLIGIEAFKSAASRKDILSYKKYGGGGYGSAIVFMGLIPILIYYYKNKLLINLKSTYVLIFIIILFLALIRMQIFANILIAIIFSLFALGGLKKLNKSLLITFIFLFIFLIIPIKFYIFVLYYFSQFFPITSNIYYKLTDMAFFLGSGAVDLNTGIGERFERYPLLLLSFTESPILGHYFILNKTSIGYYGLGAHLYWMNKLTIIGIVGFLIFFRIIYKFTRTISKKFSDQFVFYFWLAVISILVLGLLKAISGREVWYFLFIILPGMYYLPLLNTKNRKT